MNSRINYKKLSLEELKKLMGPNNPEADAEFQRRVEAGEIKLRKVTLDEIKEMYSKKKAS